MPFDDDEDDETLEVPIIRQFIEQNLLSPQQARALQMKDRRWDILDNDRILQLIFNRLISVSDAVSLTPHQVDALERNCICALLLNKIIHLPEVLRLADIHPDLTKWAYLDNAHIQTLFENQNLTLSRALRASKDELRNLHNELLVGMINKGFLTVDHVLNLNERQHAMLMEKAIRSLILGYHLPAERALILTDHQVAILKNVVVSSHIINNPRSLDAALQLQPHQLLTLNQNLIKQMIKDKLISFDQAIALPAKAFNWARAKKEDVMSFLNNANQYAELDAFV